MTRTPDARSRDSDDNVNIELEQVKIVFAAVPLSLAANLINSIILSIALWGLLAHSVILVWLSGITAISAFRWLTYRQFTAADDASRSAPSWRSLATIGTLLSGALWGSTAFLLFPADSMVHQVFLAFVIAGISAGAVTTLSAIYGLAAGFLLLTLGPMMWRFLAADHMLGHTMALMTALFALMIVVSSGRLNKTILESLQIRNQRRQAERTIRRQALYDELTRLPNRRLLLDRLRQEMARSQRHGHMGAVLFLDVDHFKTINDSLGHRVGDKLLQSVSFRLLGRLRDEDTVARIGGDEFVALIPEIGDASGTAVANSQQVALEMLGLFRQPFTIEGHELHLSASIGVTLFPLGQQDPEALLQQADVAMYSAKESGRDNTQLFLPSMQAAVDERLKIERGLRHALAHGGLELYYQPQVADDGKLIGAEALARWRHPEYGLVSPAQFICIAEETGLIYQLGDWVLRRACADLAELSVDTDLRISVNISPKQFREAGFVERVTSIVADTGAPPERLTLEITESVVIDNIEQTVERMHALKALGISFSVDDFGTGHSSLAYLKRLPLDTLKIDQSFVRDIGTDPNDAVIVETIIVMARHLGMDVIAEGVETNEALTFLRSRGCRKFQGYLFGRPGPLNALYSSLGTRRAADVAS
ncbi:MAG TPA: EAL domain-containing protein [Gammaproteobacteria bacterium]|nr:EAL domain-containing protein [Gammaproteobacteria bacterium]